MGLDITAKVSNKDYHAGYSALHGVRWLGMICCGMPEQIAGRSSIYVYPTMYILPEGITAQEIMAMCFAYQKTGYIYPNLMLHSDAEGSYTLRGQVNINDNGWMTGNSKGLLRELKDIKAELPDKFKTGRPWDTFNMLYALVGDEVENGKGHLEFH